MLTLAQKFSSALNEIDDKFIVEAIEYQHHKVKLSRGKSLLLIAVLIVGLTATVMAAHLLGIGDLLLFPKQRESGEYAQGEVVPKPCMIGLSGYMNTPEGQALSEWSAFLNQYDPDGTIASSLGNVIDESLQRYFGYTVYTKEMFDELEHIANKHSLKLHTKVYDLTIHPELLEPCSGYLGDMFVELPAMSSHIPLCISTMLRLLSISPIVQYSQLSEPFITKVIVSKKLAAIFQTAN